MKAVTHLYPNEQVATNVYEYASKCSLDLPEYVLDYYQRASESDPKRVDWMISPLQVWKHLLSSKTTRHGSTNRMTALTYHQRLKHRSGLPRPWVLRGVRLFPSLHELATKLTVRCSPRNWHLRRLFCFDLGSSSRGLRGREDRHSGV